MNAREWPFSLNDAELKTAAKNLKESNREFTDAFVKMTIPQSAEGTGIVGAYRNNAFLIQIYETGCEGIARISINRTQIDVTNRRWRDGISWDELEAIKNCFFPYKHAVEVFPARDAIVNVANIRHLFVYVDAPAPDFIWNKDNMGWGKIEDSIL